MVYTFTVIIIPVLQYKRGEFTLPLFRCTKCGCVENTATGNYWTQQDAPTCSECDTGKWHGRFLKRSADGMLIDQNGHLHKEGEKLPQHYKIVGRV
jgi:hypothetical protein